MKLRTQAIAGFAVGVIVAIVALMCRLIIPLPPPTSTIYDSVRIDGNALKTLYHSDNFAALTLYSSTTSGRIDLQGRTSYSNGSQGTVPPGFIRVFTRGTSISGDREFPGYYLEHNRISGKLQLQTLDSIITRNPGGYFTLVAGDYRIIDPTNTTNVYYQIIPYRSDGSKINISVLPPRAGRIDPCPPGHSY